MFLIASKLLDLAIAPLSWALTCILVGTVLVARKRTRGGLAFAVAAVLVLWVFASQPVADALTRAVEAPARSTIRAGVRYDAVIVLGGIANERAMRDSGQPAYNDAVDRLIAAHRMFKAGGAAMVVVSGGTWEPELRPEAEWLADQLVEWGVPRTSIVVEARSLNTRENAATCATIARERGWTELALVTSAAHLPRAVGAFEAAGVRVDALPVDFHASDTPPWSSGLLPRAQALDESSGAIRELVGRGVYRILGYTR